jgi:rod shape-determining protein MreD
VSLQLGIPVFALASLVQGAVLSRLRVYGGQPDLILVIVMAWSILDRDREGIVWAFAGGLFADLFSGTPMGVSSLALVPIAFAVGLTEAQVYRTNIFLPLVLTLLGALAFHIATLLLLRLFAGVALPWSEAFWYVTLPSVVLDVILIIPVLRVLGPLYERLHPRQVKI